MDAKAQQTLWFVVMLAAFATPACGGSSDEARSASDWRRLRIDLPAGWHGTEAPAVGTVDKKAYAAMEPGTNATVSMVVYPATSAPPIRHIGDLHRKLLQDPNASVEEPSVMYHGTYARVYWCAEGICRIEAVKQTLYDNDIVIVMRAVWNEAKPVQRDPIEDLFRTADFF